VKVLVVGAGVCGPVAAMALQQAGIDAVVCEARGPAADGGSYLTVATNGLDALRAVGVDELVSQAGFPTDRTVMFSGNGRRLGSVPIGSTRANRPVSRTIKRSHLHEILTAEAARRHVPIAFGKRLVDAQATDDGRVFAAFADGTRERADLVVGCDGVHSVVRRLIDPGAPAPRYVGLLNFGGYTPRMAVGEPAAWHMIFGARAFFGYVPDGDGGTVWFANVPRHPSSRTEVAATPADDWKRWLCDLFADDRGPATSLIADGRLELAGDNTYDLPSVPVWHRAPFIVIGDAAHAPSPSSGQGASMACEDGVVLAQCLRDVSPLDEALAAFERLRRRRVERIVADGARSSRSKAAGPIGRVMRDLMLPFVFRHLVNERSLAWIYDYHIDWLEPTRSVGESPTVHVRARNESAR
jgi:2-polyprenyl-6-methoxyphenol hydroxylase-like FAD-dependent oxidoreductase